MKAKRDLNAGPVREGSSSMGRDQSNPKHMNHQGKPENKHVTDTIEPDDAADAQSRQRSIGKELRRWYDDIVKEPVPDDLLRLLKQIDDRTDSQNDDRKKD